MTIRSIRAPWLLAIVLVTASCNDDGPTGPSPAPFPNPPPNYESITQYSEDARVLAARLSVGVWIDLEIVADIESVLEVARPLRPEFAGIHAFQDFVLDELVVRAREPALSAWQQGRLTTGDARLDSLTSTLRLTAARAMRVDSWFVLNFAWPLDMQDVVPLLETADSIELAELNGLVGDGDRIWMMRKPDHWLLVFSEGRGDCPAGCIWRSYFYVDAPDGGAPSVVEEHVPDDDNPWPLAPRWNVPARFAATRFETAENLLAHFDHADWWVRRHAIEATWRFFVHDGPPFGEDAGDRLPVWERMRDAVRARRDAVIELLRVRSGDTDADVRNAAALALDEIT